MKFDHEINQGRLFLDEIEAYLSRDFVKEKERYEGLYIELLSRHEKMDAHYQELIGELKLTIAKLGKRMGILLKESEMPARCPKCGILHGKDRTDG